MPNRHISSQSFDEILSDLGDDPAIPDPHGIRKSTSHKAQHQSPHIQNDKSLFVEALKNMPLQNPFQKIGGLITIICVVSGILLGIFFAFDSRNRNSQAPHDDSQKLILGLKKDIALMRDEILQEQNDIYDILDEIEVSIYSLNNSRSNSKVAAKPQAFPQELELRRWRYLGTAQMGKLQQAFLDTGKDLLTFEKGAQILGDWRLGNIEKELVTLTHPNGKTLVLKVSKKE